VPVRKKKPAGLYAHIKAKRERIAKGSGETMRKPGSKGAPTEKAFANSEKTAKKPRGNRRHLSRRKAKPRARKR